MASDGPSGARLFVAYYRVSTDKQGRSGLGLDAQKGTVGRFLASANGALVAEFEEVESGKRRDRPQLRLSRWTTIRVRRGEHPDLPWLAQAGP